MPPTIKTALLSYGMSGTVFHGPLLKVHPGFEVVRVWERSKNLSEDLFDKKVISRTLDSILEDKKVELVVVNTPDATHFDFAGRALHAGKHVVVEKPFVVRYSEGEELIALAQKKGLVLSVFQNRRWDGDFLTVKSVIDSGMLGRLVEFESHFDRYRNFIKPNTWKEQAEAGTGIVQNLGSHLIDQALCLFGPPGSVYADIRTMRTGGDIDDYFDIDLYYSEVKVKLKSSYLVREPGPQFIVHGTEGSFLKWGLDPQEDALKEGRLPDEPGWGTEPASLWGKLNTTLHGLHTVGNIETVPGNYLAYYTGLYDTIRKGSPLNVRPEDSLLGIRIIRAALKSAEEGRRVPV